MATNRVRARTPATSSIASHTQGPLSLPQSPHGSPWTPEPTERFTNLLTRLPHSLPGKPQSSLPAPLTAASLRGPRDTCALEYDQRLCNGSHLLVRIFEACPRRGRKRGQQKTAARPLRSGRHSDGLGMHFSRSISTGSRTATFRRGTSTVSLGSAVFWGLRTCSGDLTRSSWEVGVASTLRHHMLQMMMGFPGSLSSKAHRH